jgi:hypothetical protein
VDLVEEEDLALAQVGEDGGEVSLDLQGWAGGLLEADFKLVGDDGGEGGFAQAGRAEEKDVVEGFAAGFGGLASCSFAFSWPMNSARRVGRSFSSNALSSSMEPAETMRSASAEVCSFDLLGELTMGDGTAKGDANQILDCKVAGQPLNVDETWMLQ